MPNKNPYPREKFCTAVHAMATSPRSLQDRLLSAYMSFHPVKESDFNAPEARKLYREIMERLTVVKDAPQHEGIVPATLRQMSDSDATDLAALIVELYDGYLT